MIAPVGGGGLLSGTALAVAGVSARTRVVGAEPAAAEAVAAAAPAAASEPEVIKKGKPEKAEEEK